MKSYECYKCKDEMQRIANGMDYKTNGLFWCPKCQETEWIKK